MAAKRKSVSSASPAMSAAMPAAMPAAASLPQPQQRARSPRHVVQIATPPGVVDAQTSAMQRIRTDLAEYVCALSLRDVLGDQFTRAQLRLVRDALRTVYLPVLRCTPTASDCA